MTQSGIRQITWPFDPLNHIFIHSKYFPDSDWLFRGYDSKSKQNALFLPVGEVFTHSDFSRVNQIARLVKRSLKRE